MVESLVGKVVRVEIESRESAIRRFQVEESEREDRFHGSGGTNWSEDPYHRDARIGLISFPQQRTLVVLDSLRIPIKPKVKEVPSDGRVYTSFYRKPSRKSK